MLEVKVKLTIISGSFYILIPKPMVYDSGFPLKLDDPLKITAEKGKLIVENINPTLNEGRGKKKRGRKK